MCFRHTGACKEDGSFAGKQCQQAVLCAPCYANSRCGSLKKDDPDLPEAMIYGETCTKDSTFARLCKPAWRCFSHTAGACKEDGTWVSQFSKQCKQAVPCTPCYPNSRCRGMRDVTSTTATTTTRQDTTTTTTHWASVSGETETASAEHMASSSSACMLVMFILQSGLHTWTFCM